MKYGKLNFWYEKYFCFVNYFGFVLYWIYESFDNMSFKIKKIYERLSSDINEIQVVQAGDWLYQPVLTTLYYGELIKF